MWRFPSNSYNLKKLFRENINNLINKNNKKIFYRYRDVQVGRYLNYLEIKEKIENLINEHFGWFQTELAFLIVLTLKY